MKAINKFLFLFIVINSITWIAPQKATAQVSVSFQVFYDNLGPYGNWIDNSSYGYVWVPRVASGFEPYNTNGYWIFTEDGWTWYSDYSWGWAPFHYGRWFYDSYYGWVWVPDTEWSPGWVSWRQSNDYYGWAPIGPGISIDIAYSNSYTIPYNQWTFVRNRDFGRPNLHNYYVKSSTNVTIIKNTTVINNIHAGRSGNVRYNAGPDRADVEKHAGKKFTPVVIKENNKAGQHLSKNQLQLYRPKVERNNDAGKKPAPTKVGHWNAKSPSNNNQPSRTPTQPNKERPKQNNRPQQPTQHNPIPKQAPTQPRPPKQQPSPKQPGNTQPPKKTEPPKQQQPSQPRPPQQQHNNPPKQQPPKQHQSQPRPPQQPKNNPPKQQPQPKQQTPRPPQQPRNNPPPPQPHNEPPHKKD